VREKKVRVFHLDAFAIARAETDQPDLQFRMQGAAFHGAFFRCSGMMAREGLDEETLFATIRRQLAKKFGHRGEQVVEDNFRVIRRGFDEVRELEWAGLPDATAETAPAALEVPWYLDRAVDTAEGAADPFRFFHQVCALYKQGADPIADPFAALSAIPAATGVFRDMTDIRFEVPEFIAEKCTGCGQCWTQCPDAAIPGLVVEIEPMIRAGFAHGGNGAGDGVNGHGGGPSAAAAKLIGPLAAEVRRILRDDPEPPAFAAALARAYSGVADGLGLDDGGRGELDAEFDAAAARLAEFPLAKTAPFFTVPERRQEGAGGLLAVTVNPYACKGCNLCVEVCPDDALITVKQDDPTVERLRRNWSLWQDLPDTPDRYLQVSDLDRGIGVLHTLLLKKRHYHSMVGGDGACMGCGEKTGVHLIVSTIEAAIRPRAAAFVARLEGLVEGLRRKAGELVTVAADLEHLPAGAPGDDGAVHVDLEVHGEAGERLARITRLTRALEDLRWRYLRGPGGRGRASLGIANATGCSSVWGSSYPYNPYPYPWTNHLFQDAPSVAIGIFEGLMRKMADGFAVVRKAELEIADGYDPATHEPFFTAFDWRDFSDEEFRLCPPIVALGGDGAMLDIGFQNVSRLMASGKPIRVVVLDTQVYSNTGGQACTSGFKGQVSDMAAYGAARHGKEEQRKEMALIAMAHRSTYVLQTSQAVPAHLVGGVLRGLGSRRPALFSVYTPCQAEHGLPDSASAAAAKLALEGRAFPCLVYDPDAGTTTAERLDLEGNPALADDWPTYELSYTDDGESRTVTLPLTTADWAATEPRFAHHFTSVARDGWSDAMVPLHEYLALDAAAREGKVPFIHVLEAGGGLGRKVASAEMVELVEDRLDLWHELRELAGIEVSAKVRQKLVRPVERELRAEIEALKSDYEARIADLKERYPAAIVRKIAEALVAGGGGLAGLGLPAAAALPPSPRPAATMPTSVPAPPSPAAPSPAPGMATPGVEAVAPPAAPAPPAAEPPVAEQPVAASAAAAPAAGEAIEPYIDSELCTTCNECTQINPKMFAYDENKQAYIKDPRAGTFQELVKAAERCTARIIHPGTPLDPDEPDLEEWIERAKPFN
jgi:pyruvate-ferredoxin/flavodoxin oxidoreductase